MSDPGNHDDPHAGEHRASGLHETAQHDIASLALGEQIDPTIEEHMRTCALCLRDLDAYRQVAELARSSKRAADVPARPPAQVWDRISAELGLTDAEAAPPAEPVVPATVTPIALGLGGGDGRCSRPPQSWRSPGRVSRAGRSGTARRAPRRTAPPRRCWTPSRARRAMRVARPSCTRPRPATR